MELASDVISTHAESTHVLYIHLKREKAGRIISCKHEANAAVLTWERTKSMIMAFQELELPEVLLFFEYYHTKKLMDGSDNPNHDDASKRILSLKQGQGKAVLYYAERLDILVCRGTTICVVPSHDPQYKSSGILSVARNIAFKGRIDGTECLVREKKIDKLSTGGDRNKEIHYRSIRVQNNILINGKEILLLDDVKTTGNSIEACKQILMENGAKSVQCFVMGKTVRE